MSTRKYFYKVVAGSYALLGTVRRKMAAGACYGYKSIATGQSGAAYWIPEPPFRKSF